MTLQSSVPVPFIEAFERFLFAETKATDRLVSFYAQTRAELADFLANPPVPLSASEQAFYGALNERVTELSRQANQVAGQWVAGSIPTSFVEGAALASPGIAFNVVHDDAVRALSGYNLSLITQMNDGMRRNVQPRLRAIALARTVLPVPGTSSMSR